MLKIEKFVLKDGKRMQMWTVLNVKLIDHELIIKAEKKKKWTLKDENGPIILEMSWENITSLNIES